jgi:phosphate transport system protein
MSKHLKRAIDNLMQRLIALSARVEESVRTAIESVKQNDSVLAGRVIEMDDIIDQEEIDIEEECLKILALHQPVAGDLRTIVAVLKINNDLERIGDLSVDIAKHAIKIVQSDVVSHAFDFSELFFRVRGMLKSSLDSLIRMDASIANKVLEEDDRVDELNHTFCEQVLESMKKDPGQAHALVQFMHVSKRLERIGDHATNMAEDVIYLVTGEIVRHGTGLNPDKA